MSKPASGTALDAANSLHAGLTAAGSAVYGILEAGGTTLADSSGNGNTATLPGSGAAIVPNSGDPYLGFTAAAGGATLASTIAAPGAASVTYFWGASQTTSGTSGAVAGDPTGGSTHMIFMDGGTDLEMRGIDGIHFGGISTFTADHDYAAVYDYPGRALHVYRDGAEIAGSPQTIHDGSAGITLTALGAGYSGSTFGLVGRLRYFYATVGHAATPTEVAGMAVGTGGSPYSIFGSAALTAGTVSTSAVTPTTLTASGAACTGGTATFTYQFQRSPDNGSNAPTGVWSSVGSARSGVAAAVAPTSVGDTGLTANTKYWYRYTVTDSAGSPATANATPVSVTTPAAATSYTLGGPSSGNVGAASTNFTATPVGGYYAGTITPHSTGSGTFSPTSLTFAGSAAQTFTYTPSSTAGSPHSISTTAGPTLGTDPAAVPYTVTSAPIAYDLTPGAGIIEGIVIGSRTYPLGTSIHVEGALTWANNGGLDSWGATQAGNGSIRFAATGPPSAIEVHCDLSGAYLRLAVDGAYQSTSPQSPISGAGGSGWVSVPFTPPGDAGRHEYRIMGSALIFDAIRVTGGTVLAAHLPALPMVAYYGDSVVACDGITDGTLSTWQRTSVALGYQGFATGYPGAGVVDYPAGTTVCHQATAEYRTADATSPLGITGGGCFPPPSVVVVAAYGRNDVGSGCNGGSTPTRTAFTASCVHVIGSIRAALPSAKVVWERLIRGAIGDTASDALSGYAADAVAAAASPDVTYAQGLWANWSGDPAHGGAHPDDASSAAMAAGLVADVVAALAAGGTTAFAPIGCGFIKGI